MCARKKFLKEIFIKQLKFLFIKHIFFLRETKYHKRKKSDCMKELDDLKLTILPLGILVFLTMLWKMTQSVGVAISIIIFWMGWKQLMKKFMINN